MQETLDNLTVVKRFNEMLLATILVEQRLRFWLYLYTILLMCLRPDILEPAIDDSVRLGVE